MFTTTLFKKPVKSCDLICKIALYGEDPEESGFQNKYPWELIVNVPKPVQVVEFRDRLIGAMNLSHEFEVLFHGIVLKHDSFLPEECYEQQYGSEEDFFFRSRLVICVDLSKKLLKSALTLKEDEQSDQENVSDDGDRQTDALHEDASLENIPPKVDFEEFKSNHKSFDLFHELKRIDCDQFTEEMMKAGYDKEGAFANLCKEDFLEHRLWIPERAQQRILSLSENIARKLLLPHRSEVATSKSKLLSEKTKAKIKEIKRFRELVNNFDASDVQDELKVETCCFKHSDAVTDRYKFIRELGRVSLASTLRTSISCIDNLNCGILPVNKMIDVVEHYVTKSTIKEAFDREIFSSYISHNSRITNDELLVFNNSLGYDLLYQKVRGYTSNLNLHSIDRFISSTLKYIDENFPMFYITQNLDELMY